MLQQWCVEEKEDAGTVAVFVSVIDQYGPQRVLKILDEVVPERSADLVVSTVHAAKGLEWDRVKVHSDFFRRDTEEEMRVAYVAVTRARRELDKHLLDLAYESLRPQESVASATT
jgi:DNA helicase IV